jgi:hypothetical protein
MPASGDHELSARELLEFYAVLGREVAFQKDTVGALEAITNVAAQAIPGAEFASITRGSGHTYVTAAPLTPPRWSRTICSTSCTAAPASMRSSPTPCS